MKFSAQEEYGLRCLVCLAVEGDGGFLTIPEISNREGLTPSHVAKLLNIMRRAGFVKSIRGQSGGYSLAMHPTDITVQDVLASLGGRMFGEGFCQRHSGNLPECVHNSECIVRPLWVRIQDSVDRAILDITLQQLIDGAIERPNVTFHGAHV